MRNSTSSYNEHSETTATYLKCSFYEPDYLKNVIYYLIVLISIPGVIGNGIVIQHLGFKIKRNPVTVYIINLAVADSGTLIFLFWAGIRHLCNQDFLIEIVEGLVWIYSCFMFTYCTGQYLLTIISIDRCLALFFPNWHRCHQPPYLSPVLCTITWTVCLLLSAVTFTLNIYTWVYIFICTSVCIPLTVVSSLALFIQGYLKSQVQKRGKLLTAILFALFFSLVFSIPPVVIYLVGFFSKGNYLNLCIYGYLCACLNSSVNPLIYVLLGERRYIILDEEESEQQSEVPVDSQL
uniref:G-protein coupled receptors family 1 profile domain-containing protein n=1 Tax=Naja naja TaxID=35670 RepID=A0A8C6XAY8_NAJNA